MHMSKCRYTVSPLRSCMYTRFLFFRPISDFDMRRTHKELFWWGTTPPTRQPRGSLFLLAAGPQDMPEVVLILAHLALFTANAILGCGSVVSKIGLNKFNPVMFALLREACAAPLLFLWSCMDTHRARVDMTWRDAVQFFRAGCALFGTNVLYIIGVKVLGATVAAIWQSALPVFTMLLAVAVGYERLTVLKATGVLCAFIGCAFITLWSQQHDEASGGVQLVGNLIFLVQVISCAAFFVAEKSLLRRWSPIVTLAYSYAIASALMLFAALFVNNVPALLEQICPDCDGNGWAVPRDAMLAVAYWVFGGSVLGYFLLTWGNQHVEASMVGIYFTVQPLAAVACAAVVIALTPPPHYGLDGPGVQDLGAIGIFIGVVMLVYDASRRASPSDAGESDDSGDRAMADDERVGGVDRAGPMRIQPANAAGLLGSSAERLAQYELLRDST
jgi:drug/metabolite transporter (DMT)-like permease